MHKKKGDTLIEVALAIGIFSLVAITVVAVVSASTTGAQSSLELTLTREEMDAQAEALRFIHDSYISGSQSKDGDTNPYYKLWSAIENTYSVNNKDTGAGWSDSSPNNCADLYDDHSNGFMEDGANRHQFIVNIRALGEFAKDHHEDGSPVVEVTDVLVPAYNVTSITTSPWKFYEATTYPRILYGDKGAGSETTDESLYGQTDWNSNEIQRVEGLFIMAVQGTANMITGTAGTTSEKPAYYDFYIRSCWNPPNSEKPSTISTVIRLYDPLLLNS